jgi:hypothetical protein
MFDTRQLATLILATSFLAVMAIHPGVRESYWQILRQFVQPAIWLPFVLYGSWLAGLHWLALKVGLWNPQLLGESIFWGIASGAALLVLSATQAPKKDNFFRDRLWDTVKFGAFLGFFLNVKSLNLIGELLLQPFLAVVVALQAVAAGNPRQANVRRLMGGVLAITGLTLLTYTIVYVVRDWTQINRLLEIRKLLMPVWLTLCSMPFVFGFALLAAYSSLFGRMKAGTDSKPLVRARLGVMLGLRTRLLDIQGMAWPYTRQAGRATTVRAGMEAVRDFRANRTAEREAERVRLLRLDELAGVEGTDADGRQLDRREFAETKEALRYLAMCQVGWYNNQGGGYRPELLTTLEAAGGFEAHGLPSDHRIVMRVRKDGKAWYAFRRTVGDWVFGIGARKPPTDEWFYDGPQPPTSYPRPGHGWGGAAHVDTVNWKYDG